MTSTTNRQRPPRGWNIDRREGHLACPHRDLSVCPSCLTENDEAIDVYGQAFWVPDPDERAKLRAECSEPLRDPTDPVTVGELTDGDEFSLDGGATWHTCAVVLFGTVSVYADARRDDDAPTIRIDAPRNAIVVTR